MLVLGGADAPGATPLGPDEVEGLIPTHVAARGDLDAAELENIVAARLWAARRSWPPERLLRVDRLREVHRRMFGDVWRWAGTLRRRDTNIGVPWPAIPVALRDLVDDATVWLAAGTYPPDVAVLRFHHRLVLVHPFPNGNGRHARFYADLLARELGRPPFTWGGVRGFDPVAARAAYLAAVRAMDADPDDVEPLLAFART